MLRTILGLYTAGMAGDVRSPMAHIVGPPGCGKSTFVQHAANLLGVKLHVINVSRISPLDLEGVQMPTEGKLELLLSTYWNTLQEGDILLLDEFLRGFPEVYNGLLDIFTSRMVAGHQLPKVFIIGASNSTTAYDPALTDRLLHLPVPDPRTNKNEHTRISTELVEAIGLVPTMGFGMELTNLVDQEILPMYQMMDMQGNSVGGSTGKGCSPRNLIGQAKLRYVTSPHLASLLEANNREAMAQGKPQYAICYQYNGRFFAPHDTTYVSKAAKLMESPRLSDLQRLNTQLNLQLIQADEAMKEASNAQPVY